MRVIIPPEQGQLVDVRQRRYVVTEVRKSALPTSLLLTSIPAQHLVSLLSVEDDGLGEELQVIWEIEPGAVAYEKMELPTPVLSELREGRWRGGENLVSLVKINHRMAEDELSIL